MSKSSTNHNLLVFLALATMLLQSCTEKPSNQSRVESLPYYAEATFTPQWELTHSMHEIPAFSLTNQHGEEVTEQLLDGKVTVVDFFFTTCPGICPKMTDNMLLVQEAFRGNDEVQIFSHSVTPEYDSAAVLLRYAKDKGITSKNWHLLTGDRSVIYDLGRNQYFIEENLGLAKDPDDFIHTENFVLVDQNRRSRGIYNGLNKASVKQLIVDMETLVRAEN